MMGFKSFCCGPTCSSGCWSPSASAWAFSSPAIRPCWRPGAGSARASGNGGGHRAAGLCRGRPARFPITGRNSTASPDRRRATPSKSCRSSTRSLRALRSRNEKTYSEPFATRLYAKETVDVPGRGQVREYPRLKFGGAHLGNGKARWRPTSASPPFALR